MARTRIPYRRAEQALAKQRAGKQLTGADRTALDNLTTRLGLARPLDEYAPRTQRRYMKAAREGIPAKAVNSTEYRQRRIAAADRPAEIAYYRALIAETNIDGQLSDADAADIIELYGEAFLARVLHEQWQSIKAWNDQGRPRQGSDPGNRRWNARYDVATQYRKGSEIDASIDPLFYYHGRIT